MCYNTTWNRQLHAVTLGHNACDVVGTKRALPYEGTLHQNCPVTSESLKLDLCQWWEKNRGGPLPTYTYKNQVKMVKHFRTPKVLVLPCSEYSSYLGTTDNSSELFPFFRSIRAIINICAFLSLFTVVINAAPPPQACGFLDPTCHGTGGPGGNLRREY